MFCKNCGKEMNDDWKVCPSCGASVEDNKTMAGPEAKKEIKQKKAKKPIFKKWWFWILIVLGVFIATLFMGGNEDSSKDKVASKSDIVKAAEKMEVKTLEEAGGIDAWEKDGYPGRVRMDIVVTLPVTPRDDDNYAVQLQTSLGTTVMVTQEDDKPAKDWEWLMNAETISQGNDTVSFKATLIHCGGTLIDDKVIPRFIVTDMESYSDIEKSLGQAEKTMSEDEVFTVPITVVNNTGIDIYGLYASTADIDDWEEDILGYEILENGESFDIDFSFTLSETIWDFAIKDIDDNMIEFYDMDLSKYKSNGAILTLKYDGENGYADLSER